MDLECALCGRKYEYLSRSKKGHTLTKCNSCCVNERRKEIKPKAVAYKGGRCELCGYNKCMAALDFHHKNPAEKEFSISGMHCLSWSKLKSELDKCILVCANCHREIHASLAQL